jgi:serine/threonine-protein phosphatase 6 regulatory subunit 3
MLHHHVESIISLCLESNSQTLLDHLFKDCNFLTKLLTADENPYAPDTTPELKSLGTRTPTRIGNIGHLTRLANKIVQASTLNPIIQNHLQANPNWGRWEMSVLQQRNLVEDVYQWTCGYI